MLTIYGATGYTGRLIAALLAQKGRPFRLAGRSRDKLEALARAIRPSLPEGAPPPELEAVAIEDPAGLTELMRRSKVVVSCAGPFRRLGPPVVEACIEGGAHYLDITGELQFMLETKRRDAEAKQRGIVLTNAVGFDVVPTDLAAHLAARALGEVPDQIEIALWVRRARLTAGTRRSAAGMAFESSAALVGGEVVAEPFGARSRELLFPGRDRPRRVVSVPLGDLATIPATTGARNARTYLTLNPRLIGISRALSSLGRTPLGAPVRALASRIMSGGAEGPSEEDRPRTEFAIVAEAAKNGRTTRATLTGCDPYGLTAHTVVHAAFSLLDAPGDRSGWLSPMQVATSESWRALLERLGARVDVSR